MRFEVGKHYEHTTGKKMHILGEVNSDMYYSPCLVAEDLEGNFIPVGIGEEYAVNWNEIEEIIEQLKAGGKEWDWLMQIIWLIIFILV